MCVRGGFHSRTVASSGGRAGAGKGDIKSRRSIDRQDGERVPTGCRLFGKLFADAVCTSIHADSIQVPGGSSGWPAHSRAIRVSQASKRSRSRGRRKTGIRPVRIFHTAGPLIVLAGLVLLSPTIAKRTPCSLLIFFFLRNYCAGCASTAMQACPVTGS